MYFHINIYDYEFTVCSCPLLAQSYTRVFKVLCPTGYTQINMFVKNHCSKPFAFEQRYRPPCSRGIVWYLVHYPNIHLFRVNIVYLLTWASFSAWHVRLAQYYKTDSESDKNNHLRETLSDPIHEYRESKEASITEKLKKKHTSEHTPSSKHSSERSKHKKRSRSKTRKRSLSKSRKHDHNSESKRRKSDSSLSRQSLHNGKDLGYETPKKKDHVSRRDSNDDKVNSKSEKNDKHTPSRPTSSTNTNSTNTISISTMTHNNSSLQTPTKTEMLPDKVVITCKPSPSSTKSLGITTPKKNHKKSESKTPAPVDLLDKIMRDMDGKNWS